MTALRFVRSVCGQSILYTSYSVRSLTASPGMGVLSGYFGSRASVSSNLQHHDYKSHTHVGIISLLNNVSY
jgi:hypothetical protein